jgi:regulator of protease activity HflC (stomatin/prohibitin superfamily)
MDASVLKYIIFGSIGLLVIAGIAYFALAKQMGKSEYARIKKLQQGTKTSGFSMDVLYQRLYITFIKIPFIKRYLFKLRRRLEILNIDDEYSTRRDSAKILMNAINTYTYCIYNNYNHKTEYITYGNFVNLRIVRCRFNDRGNG